jgi:hypothetical protein
MEVLMARSSMNAFAALLLAVAVTSPALSVCPTVTPNCSLVGAPSPVALTSNKHYFTYRGNTLPLIGISYEYLPHVCIEAAPFNTEYVNLQNFGTVFPQLAGKHDNVIRLAAIFNSSPGKHLQGTPFPDEGPFFWNGSQSLWDPSQPIDGTWLKNLEAVVCSAYSQGIVVQVTLFDPWDPSWVNSPFNPVNTVNKNQGFISQQFFASFDQPPPSTTDSNLQNVTARGRQVAALTAVVNRLKPYPNVIWQIANEPDLNSAAPIASVVTWEAYMANRVRSLDSSHLIMVNGHTGSSFSWNVSGNAFPTIESAHYTQINQAGFDGAITLMRDANYNVQKATVAIGFDENQAVGDSFNFPWRNADDIRAEAWEFSMYSGGLFNGYSVDQTVKASQDVATQLGVLYSFLKPNVSSVTPIDLNSMAQTNCASGSWCKGITGWGLSDPHPSCVPSLGVGNVAVNPQIYWSTMASQYNAALYIHHAQLMSSAPGGPKYFDGYHEISCGNGSTSGYQTALQFTPPFSGCWQLSWIDPRTNVGRSSQFFQATAGTYYTPTQPYYTDDIVVLLSYFRSTCY